MPCLWLTHNNSQIFTSVSIIDASSIKPDGKLSALPSQFTALIDTGAQKTMISTNVVRTIGLKSVVKIKIQGVGPAAYHNGYVFHVAFSMAKIPSGGQTAKPGTQAQLMVFVYPIALYGAELEVMTGFDVLLGMDILSSGSLKVEGNGTASFSF